MGALVPQPVNVTESAFEGWPGCPQVVPPGPQLLMRARSRSQHPSVSCFQESVPCSPTALSSEDIYHLQFPHSEKGASPLVSCFSVHKAPDGPILSPWRGREWPHAGPESESLSSMSLRPGPREEARRPLQSLWAGSALWWPVVGSNGPARSSRRCPSYAAAAGVGWNGSTGH